MNGSTGGPVRPMDTDHIRRAMADDNECGDCAELGHICRPCRALRYEARNPTERASPRARALFWRAYLVLLVVIVVAVVAYV